MPSLVTRAGRYVKQASGYRAFILAPLPPDPPIEISPAMLAPLSQADQALGRLDGMAVQNSKALGARRGGRTQGIA